MWLVLCSADDHPALWAARQLRARGLEPLLVLTPELLHYSFAWEHRLGPARLPSIGFTLADGRRVRGEAIRGVLNRLSVLPGHLVERFPEADRAYALQEWTALHVSWLTAIPGPVVNRPSGSGLGGAWRHQSEWLWLAAEAGLPIPRLRLGTPPPADAAPAAGGPAEAGGSVRRAIVLDGETMPADLPAALRAACSRLATLASTRLLGVELDPDTHRFLSATPMPDLRDGGDHLVAALHRTLSGHA